MGESRGAIAVLKHRPALAHKIGEPKIKQLRAKAQSKLGNKFDLRDFHDLNLQNGTIPLDVLEGVVNEWLAAKK